MEVAPWPEDLQVAVTEVRVIGDAQLGHRNEEHGARHRVGLVTGGKGAVADDGCGELDDARF